MKDILKNWQKNDLYLAASIFYFIGAAIELTLTTFLHANFITSALAMLAIVIGLAFTFVSMLGNNAE